MKYITDSSWIGEPGEMGRAWIHYTYVSSGKVREVWVLEKDLVKFEKAKKDAFFSCKKREEKCNECIVLEVQEILECEFEMAWQIVFIEMRLSRLPLFWCCPPDEIEATNIVHLARLKELKIERKKGREEARRKAARALQETSLKTTMVQMAGLDKAIEMVEKDNEIREKALERQLNEMFKDL